MKHYAHTSIYLVCLASAWLLYGCRTTYQNNRSTQEQTALSISDSALSHRTRDTSSQFNLHQEEAGKDWKIKVNFDTSKPTDPSTGLPPISDIEIEGSEKTVQTLLQKDDTLHLSENQETKTSITFQQDQHSISRTEADNSVFTGMDDGIRYGLIIGIPLILITISIYYARYRQKNPSK